MSFYKSWPRYTFFRFSTKLKNTFICFILSYNASCTRYWLRALYFIFIFHFLLSSSVCHRYCRSLTMLNLTSFPMFLKTFVMSLFQVVAMKFMSKQSCEKKLGDRQGVLKVHDCVCLWKLFLSMLDF